MGRPTRIFTGLAVAACIGAAATGAGAASSTTVVTVSVPSATNLTTAACSSATAATQIGMVQPGSTAMTATDCTVAFGSSNDTASLRLSQTDGDVRGMYRPLTGGLNAGFNGTGRRITPTGSGADLYTAVARDANGMFIAVGSYYNGTRNKVVVGRYRPDGTLDPAFNGGAVRQISIGATDDVAYSVAVQADRRIILVGNSNNDSFVMRLNADGTTDWTQVNDLGTGTDWAKGVALQPTGEVLVSGIAYSGAGNLWNLYLERRSAATGALDPTFNGTGRLVVSSVITAASPRITVSPPIVHPDGKVTVCDYTTAGGTPDLWLMRVNGDGTWDAGFNGTGRVTVPGADLDFCGPGVLQSNGMIAYPSATTTAGGVGTVRVVRLRTDGTLDPAFGSSGVATAAAVGDAYVGAVLQQEDGALVAFGVRRASTTYAGVAVRWSSAGVVDSTLDQGSYTAIDIGSPTLPPAGGATTWGADGMPVTASGHWNGTNLDLVVYQLGTTTVPDYGGATTWASAGGAFGACLASVAGAGTTAAWTAGGGACTVGDNGTWYGVPQTTGAANAIVARSTTAATTTATANLRFAMRASMTQSPGTYVAPITFSVVAPMV